MPIIKGTGNADCMVLPYKLNEAKQPMISYALSLEVMGANFLILV